MRAEDDFVAYVAARRGRLEEVVVRLGCPPGLAPEVVDDGLARCRRRWARTMRQDPDPVVLAAVLTAWDRRRPSTAWEGDVPSVLAEVAEVAGPRADDALDDVVRARRRRPTARALAALAALVLAVVVAARWPDADPADEDSVDRLSPVEVTSEENVLDTVWSVGAELRLSHGRAEVGPVRDLVAVPDGAVYVDADDRVVRIDGTGARTVLGSAAPDSAVVAAGDGSLVAWREPRGDLVLHDGRGEAGRIGGAGLEPVAIDRGRLYFDDPAGSSSYAPGGVAVRVAPWPLLDVRGGSRLFQVAPRLVRLERPSLGRVSVVAGRGGSLSPDGRFALVGAGAAGVRVHDVLGGAQDAGLAAGEHAAAGTLVLEGRVLLAVAVGSGLSSGFELRTCTLGTGDCERGPVLPAERGVPRFAG